MKFVMVCEKLVVSQLVKQILAFYGTKSFMIVFARVRH